jgi:hypothetical protein
MPHSPFLFDPLPVAIAFPPRTAMASQPSAVVAEASRVGEALAHRIILPPSLAPCYNGDRRAQEIVLSGEA